MTFDISLYKKLCFIKKYIKCHILPYHLRSEILHYLTLIHSIVIVSIIYCLTKMKWYLKCLDKNSKSTSVLLQVKQLGINQVLLCLLSFKINFVCSQNDLHSCLIIPLLTRNLQLCLPRFHSAQLFQLP